MQVFHLDVHVSYLKVSLMWDILQDDGLHGENVGKLHLRDVERAHYVGPAWAAERLEEDDKALYGGL